MAAPLASTNTTNPTGRMVLTALATWLLPGAGHLLIGDRTRGIVFMVVITLTFWTGVAIGGVKNTVSPVDRTLWFAGQICAGGHALVALGLASTIENPIGKEPGTGPFPAAVIGYGRTEEVSVVYTAIAGMLNILIILDVMVRAEKPVVPVTTGPPASKPPKRG